MPQRVRASPQGLEIEENYCENEYQKNATFDSNRRIFLVLQYFYGEKYQFKNRLDTICYNCDYLMIYFSVIFRDIWKPI